MYVSCMFQMILLPGRLPTLYLCLLSKYTHKILRGEREGEGARQSNTLFTKSRMLTIHWWNINHQMEQGLSTVYVDSWRKRCNKIHKTARFPSKTKCLWWASFLAWMVRRLPSQEPGRGRNGKGWRSSTPPCIYQAVCSSRVHQSLPRRRHFPPRDLEMKGVTRKRDR